MFGATPKRLYAFGERLEEFRDIVYTLGEEVETSRDVFDEFAERYDETGGSFDEFGDTFDPAGESFDKAGRSIDGVGGALDKFPNRVNELRYAVACILSENLLRERAMASPAAQSLRRESDVIRKTSLFTNYESA